MNGISRIGSFLFGQGVNELAAEESTRMADSDSGGESHVGLPVGERVHVVGDLNVSAVPRDVLGSSDDTLPSLDESYDLRQTPDIRQRQFPDTPRPQPQPQSYGGIFCRRFQQPLSEIESQGDSMTVNTSGGNVTSPTTGKYGTPFSTSELDDSLGAAARTSTDVDGSQLQTTDLGKSSPSGSPGPNRKRRVDWASTPQDGQAPSGIVDYSPSPVTPLRPILKRQQRVYGNQTPYWGAQCHDVSSDSGYPQTPPSFNSTGNSNYSSYVSDFSLSPGGTQMSPVSRCTVKPKKFDGKNWSGYKLHFLSVAQANCWNQNEAARVLKSSLDDDVALMLRRRLRRGDATLEAVFAALDDRFNVPGPDYVLRIKVRRTIQKPNQPVAQFQKELMRVLACRVDAEESPEALEQFVHGLADPKMQKYVAKRQPEDIHEALLYAREYEETNAWMNSATRSVTKRISLVSVANGSAEEQSKSTSDDKSAEKPTSENDQLLAELVKKVEALETYKREAEERSRYWKEKKQQWKNNRNNNKNNRQNQGNQNDNRAAIRLVNVSDEQDAAPADDANDGES